MRKKLLMCTVIALIATMQVNTVFAIEVLPKDRTSTMKEISDEPLIEVDPNETKMEDDHGKTSHYVRNGLLEDTGKIELEWNSRAYATYGCSTATINYGNPAKSNIDMTLKVALFDGDLIEYFGTTFRPEKEINEFAAKGLKALQNGIRLSDAAKLVNLETKYFDEMTPEEISKLSKKEIISILGEKEFAGMTEKELSNLNKKSVKKLSEVNKLTLAQLGGYGFYTNYMTIGETGVIEPGYAIYQVDLYTLPGSITLPKGEYKAIYVLNSYDKYKNEFSDFFIHLPVTLEVQEDLPEELQKEYKVTLAKRIDISQ